MPTVIELKKIARELGLMGFSQFRKSQLEQLIFKAQKTEKSSNIKQLIIITTPHEFCKRSSQETHTCDPFAIKLANQLVHSLKDDSREIILFHGNIYRKLIDLNRAQSRETNFRKMIRNKLEDQIKKLLNSNSNSNRKNKIIYLLDCHSFRGNSFANIRIQNPDVSVLFNCHQLLLLEELTESLRDNGIIATKHIGGKNDIIIEADSLNIKYELWRKNIIVIPLLIEVNENISDQKLTLVGKSINQWIHNVNNFLNLREPIKIELWK